MLSSTCISLFVAITMTAANPSSGYVLPHERPSRIVDRDRDRPQAPILLELTDNSRPPTRGSTSVNSQSAGLHSRLHLFSIPRELQGVKGRLDVAENDIEVLDNKYDSVVEQVNNIQTRIGTRSPANTVSQLRSAGRDLVTRVARLEEENEQLRGFLVTFERFLNRLMSEDPSAYDPTAAPSERLSRLHEYLGNAEAELIGVNQPAVADPQAVHGPWADNGGAPPLFGQGTDNSPSTNDTHVSSSNTSQVQPAGQDVGTAQVAMASGQSISGFSVSSSHTGVPSKGNGGMRGAGGRTTSSMTSSDTEGVHLSVDQADRLAVAIEQLSTQNQELTTRLQTLEQKASDSNPIGVQSFGIASQTTNSAVTEELLDKVDRLEQVVALQASAVLDDSAFSADRTFGASQARGTGSGGVGIFTASLDHSDGSVGVASVGSTSKKAPPTMNQDDVEIMKEVLEEARSQGSGSRKSAFSVARTSYLLGSANVPKLVEFDHVFVNKGRDFNRANSTFICERAGYYFITFTLRSYDGRYLGVSLMKNSDVVTAVYTDAHSRNVMESQSVVVHLEPGDALYLLLGPSNQFALHSDFRKYVTFSGFMIYSGY